MGTLTGMLMRKLSDEDNEEDEEDEEAVQKIVMW